MTLSARLALVLCGIAILSTGLALLPQERALPQELERAAHARLERAAAAANRLLQSHLQAFEERTRSVSRTPELRANLETGHAPTLQYFTGRLVREQGVAGVAFLDREGRPLARAGDLELLDAALVHVPEAGPEDRSFAFEREAAVFSAASISLRAGGRRVGALLAVDPIGAEALSLWSELCGAHVEFTPPGPVEPGALSVAARQVGPLALTVRTSLDAERRALERARHELLTSGALALALAFGVSLLVARGLVRPIRRIQDATGTIGRGELHVRLHSERRDEIGDVSRAFDGMLDRLEGTLVELRTSQGRLGRAQRMARLGGWSLDIASGQLHASEQARTLFGLPGTGPARRGQLLTAVHPEDREAFTAGLELCRASGTPFRLDHRTRGSDGNERYVHSQGERVEHPDGARLEGAVQDITERRLVEEQVRYLAYHDALTGLGNRRLFVERLELALREAQRSGEPLGLIFLDLDGFKRINDTLGHSVGDTLLREVGARLVECALSYAPQTEARALVARFGGDEFTLLVTPIAGPEDPGRLARRILRRLSEPVELDGHEVVVNASIGIATWPADGADAETLLRNGDTAMYHAKEQGRGNYQFFSEPMNALVFKRLMLENKLRKAIDDGQLALQFQPKVELATRRVMGLEALVRWRDPELGAVSPAEFIPLAEETGLIGAVGDWVLQAAVRQIAAWRETDLADLCVSVNLSAHQLAPPLTDQVRTVLAEAGVDASRLDLEITETAVMKRDTSVLRTLQDLRKLGVRLSLDDFGTGYSSLSHLRALPIDTLKIDRSFVHRMEAVEDDAALVGAILSMARVLRLRVVVEGVETAGQIALLEEFGCDEVQGHWFSTPVDAEEVPRVRREIEQGAGRKPPSARGRAPRGPRRRR